ELVFFFFSSLHKQNESVYRHLNAWNSLHFRHSNLTTSTFIKSSFDHRKFPSMQDSVNEVCLRNRSTKLTLKTNLFLQSVSANQMGFTCGRLYYFTKYTFIENLFVNLGLLSLFYEKIKI